MFAELLVRKASDPGFVLSGEHVTTDRADASRGRLIALLIKVYEDQDSPWRGDGDDDCCYVDKDSQCQDDREDDCHVVISSDEDNDLDISQLPTSLSSEPALPQIQPSIRASPSINLIAQKLSDTARGVNTNEIVPSYGTLSSILICYMLFLHTSNF